MQTRRLKSFLIIACILAMGAGVVAGMVVSRLPGRVAGGPLPTDRSSELADELKLSEPQRNQMRSVWENVRTAVHDTYDQAQALQRQRDDAVIAMLTPEQRAKYSQLTNRTAEQFAALSAKRDAAFRDGVDQTKHLLDPSQREKYDRILRDRVGTVPNLGSAAGSASGSGVAGGFSSPALSSTRPSE